MSDELVRELTDLAAELATSAGRMVLAGRLAGVSDARTKSSATDVATEWDRASEDFLVGELALRRPDDAVIAEEGSQTAGSSGITWLIDPIDGTTNFLYDLPGYAVSIAAADAEGPLAGAVYLPVTDELFTAGRGAGAYRNGEAITPTAETDPRRALVATGFSYSVERRRAQARRAAVLLGEVRDIRRLGAASVDLCYTAMGRLDAYYEEGLMPWDLAAGWLIAVEAGATVGAIDHGPARPDSVLAAAPALFEPLRAMLATG